MGIGEVVVSRPCSRGRRKYYCRNCFVDARGEIIPIPMSEAVERMLPRYEIFG